MGWPKYFEDNNELIQDRLYFQGDVKEIESDGNCITADSLLKIDVYAPRIVSVNMSKKEDQPKRKDGAKCRECGGTVHYSKKLRMVLDNNGWEGPRLCKKCLQKKAQASLGKHKH